MAVYGLKNKSDILMSVLNGLEKNAGITAVYPGSIARAFAEAFTTEVADLYDAFKFSINQNNLSTASGRNLDLIGDLYGITRKSVSNVVAQERQSYNIEFFIDKPYSSTITVPKGTLVYTDVSAFMTRQYSFKLVDAVVIATASTRAYGRVEPNFSDNSYVAPVNSLTKHNFIAPPTVVLFSNNPKEVYAAINAETDDNFRKRIVSAIRGSSSGTAESIRFAALSVKGVKDVKIKEGSYGIGSCDLFIVPESSSSLGNIPEIVYTAVSGAKPLGIRINTRVAMKKAVDVSITLSLRQGTSAQAASSIEMQARIFLIRYLNSLTIGSSISVQEIESQAKYASDFITGVTVNNLSVDKKNVPNVSYRLSDDKSYMGAGAVGVYSVIIGSSGY